MKLPLEPAFTTAWPEPRHRWLGEASQFVGVYGLRWRDNIYVGMTVSSGGFRGRWASHHRALFVRKRANSTTRKMRAFIKDEALSPSDFELLALRCWPLPANPAPRELADEIAVVEREIYDQCLAAGFTMLNNVRPSGAGYTVTARRKRRRAPRRKS